MEVVVEIVTATVVEGVNGVDVVAGWWSPKKSEVTAVATPQKLIGGVMPVAY